jgi:hypothetical protein
MGLPAAATFGLQPPCRPGSMAARTYLSDEADRHVAQGAMRSTPRPRTARHLSPRKRGLVDESPRPRSAYGDASPESTSPNKVYEIAPLVYKCGAFAPVGDGSSRGLGSPGLVRD